MKNIDSPQEKQIETPEEIDFKKEFADFFGPLMPSILTLRRIGHFGSFLTASYSVNSILKNNFGLVGTIGLLIMAVVLAVSACLAIEYGVSKVVPIWCRQLIRFKFANRWFIGMFVILSIVVVPLAILSPMLSHDGGEDAIKDYALKIERQSPDSLINTYASQKEEVLQSFAPRLQEIRDDYDKQRVGLEDQYKKLVQVQYDKYDEYDEKKQEGYDWAQGHMNAAVKERKRLQAEASTKLAELDKAESAALHPLLHERDLELQSITQIKVVDLRQFHTQDSVRIATLTAKQNRRENTASSIALVCVLLTFICIGIIEFYKAGAGQEIETKAYKESEHKLRFSFKGKKRIRLSDWFQPQAETSNQKTDTSDTKDAPYQSEILDNQEITLIQNASSDDLIIMLRNSYRRRITTKDQKKRHGHMLKAELIWDLLTKRGFKLKSVSQTGFQIVEYPKQELSLLPA